MREDIKEHLDEHHVPWVETQDLDQAVHGLTAAIHLLTARHDPSTPRGARAA